MSLRFGRKHRSWIRIAPVLLLTGVLAPCLVTVSLADQREPDAQQAAQTGAKATGSSPADRATIVRTYSTLLLAGAVLVLVFLVGSYAIVRFSRRMQEQLEHRRQASSPSADVWKMYRLPEEAESGSDVSGESE